MSQIFADPPWLNSANLKKSALDELQSKIIEKRDKIAFELLTTEQNYVRSLTVLLHVWKIPLKERQKEIGISDEQIVGLFGNLEEILKVNTMLLDSLFKCFKDWSPQQTLAPALRSLVPFLKMYKQYAVNYHPSTRMNDKLKKREKVKTVLDEISNDPLCQGLDLGAYLIMPIQRIPRYVLLLTELLKNTLEDHPDLQGLQKILEEVRLIADYVNIAPKLAEEGEKTFSVVKKFDKYKDNRSLLAPNRFYLMDGDLQEITNKGQHVNRHFFLFTDMVLLASLKGGKWVIKHQFENTEFSVADDPTLPNSFVINIGPKSFRVQAPDSEEKKKWMETLRKIRSGGGITTQLSDAKDCILCLKKFGKSLIPTRCAVCHNIVCQFCSGNTIKAEPLCDTCFEKMNAEKRASIFHVNFSNGGKRSIPFKSDELLLPALEKLCSKLHININLCTLSDDNGRFLEISQTTSMGNIVGKSITIVVHPGAISAEPVPTTALVPVIQVTPEVIPVVTVASEVVPLEQSVEQLTDDHSFVEGPPELLEIVSTPELDSEFISEFSPEETIPALAIPPPPTENPPPLTTSLQDLPPVPPPSPMLSPAKNEDVPKVRSYSGVFLPIQESESPKIPPVIPEISPPPTDPPPPPPLPESRDSPIRRINSANSPIQPRTSSRSCIPKSATLTSSGNQKSPSVRFTAEELNDKKYLESPPPTSEKKGTINKKVSEGDLRGRKMDDSGKKTKTKSPSPTKAITPKKRTKRSASVKGRSSTPIFRRDYNNDKDKPKEKKSVNRSPSNNTLFTTIINF